MLRHIELYVRPCAHPAAPPRSGRPMTREAAQHEWWRTFEVVFGVPGLMAIARHRAVPWSLPSGPFSVLLVSIGITLLISGTTGVFAYSRNLLYLGGIAIVLGLVPELPDPVEGEHGGPRSGARREGRRSHGSAPAVYSRRRAFARWPTRRRCSAGSRGCWCVWSCARPRHGGGAAGRLGRASLRRPIRSPQWSALGQLLGQGLQQPLGPRRSRLDVVGAV